MGELTPAGTLKVVDRIKNMFKLAQGEYIAAEHLENKFTCGPFPTQRTVLGHPCVPHGRQTAMSLSHPPAAADGWPPAWRASVHPLTSVYFR